MRRRSVLMASLAIAGLLAMSSQAYGDTVLFSLLPGDGNIAGPAGSVIGWGYSVTNSELTDWFVPVLLNADSFSNGTPSLIFDFPNVSPGATITAPFDAGTGAGLYQLTWDPGAPLGFANSGNFVLSAQWWDGDPTNTGSNFLFNEPDITLAYTATVTESGVPEPSTWWLVLGPILVACGRRLRLFSFRTAPST